MLENWRNIFKPKGVEKPLSLEAAALAEFAKTISWDRPPQIPANLSEDEKEALLHQAWEAMAKHAKIAALGESYVNGEESVGNMNIQGMPAADWTKLEAYMDLKQALNIRFERPGTPKRDMSPQIEQLQPKAAFDKNKTLFLAIQSYARNFVSVVEKRQPGTHGDALATLAKLLPKSAEDLSKLPDATRQEIIKTIETIHDSVSKKPLREALNEEVDGGGALRTDMLSSSAVMIVESIKQ